MLNKRLLKLFYIFISTVFLFIFVDLFFGNQIINLFFVGKSGVIKHPIYHHDLDKNLRIKKKYNIVFPHELCTDKFGFRVSCLNQKDTSKIIDYAFIGDSFTEGSGLNYKDTFTGLFAKNNKDLNVVNLGVGSYSPKIYFKKIQYLIENGFKFKNVIIFLDVGDIFDENVYEHSSKGIIVKKNDFEIIKAIYQDYSLFYKIKKILKAYLPNTFIIYKKITNFKTKSDPENDSIYEISNSKYDLINSRWAYQNKFSLRDEKWKIKGINQTKKYLDKIFELGQLHNFKISLAAYPWPGQILIDEDSGRRNIGSLWKNYCERKCEHFFNYLEDFHQIKQKIGSKKVVDLYFLKNDVHFNKKGNELIFSKLYKFFK